MEKTVTRVNYSSRDDIDPLTDTPVRNKSGPFLNTFIFFII